MNTLETLNLVVTGVAAIVAGFGIWRLFTKPVTLTVKGNGQNKSVKVSHHPSPREVQKVLDLVH